MSELFGGNMVFPIHNINDEQPYDEGMSIRDYIAIQAMQALIKGGQHPNVHELSRDAYKVADAMLEVRNGEQ